MEQLNRTDIETSRGSGTFELLCGDIVDLEGAVDLLIISSQHQFYDTNASSVIGALHRRLSIDVGRLAARPDLDFRDALSCWVARAPSKSKFRHILCVEVFPKRSHEDTIKYMFSNVFATIAALEAKEYKLGTIAMPPLGTGRGSLDPDLVMRAMLDHSLAALERSRVLRTIQFVVRDEAYALGFSDAMDRALGRDAVVLPQSAAILKVRRKIADRIDTTAQLIGDTKNPILKDLRKAVLSTESRPFVLGLSARKVIEFLVHDLMAGKKYKDVNAALDQLTQRADGPALWIMYYMQVIRTLGNNAAHTAVTKERYPANPNQADLELLLLCLLRVLDFWIDWKQQKPSALPLQAEQSSLLVDDPMPE